MPLRQIAFILAVLLLAVYAKKDWFRALCGLICLLAITTKKDFSRACSIEEKLLFLSVLVLSAYAWKDWLKSLCGLIILMAILESKEMPRTMWDIQGLNPWNVLMVNVVLSWLAHRYRERLRWDMPPFLSALLIVYLGVIVIGFLRAVIDRSHLENYSISAMVSEELINTVKWVIPGLLLYDGCRKPERVRFALAAILVMSFFLAIQVVRQVPWASALGGAGASIDKARLEVCQRIGYSRCSMSPLLGGASWAMLACVPLVKRLRHRLLLLGSAGVTAFGQALTGGRAGYAAWMATGLVLCAVKWRRYLVVAPIVPFVLMLIFPAAAERALHGFGTDVYGQSLTEEKTVTAGRSEIWPHVTAKIRQAPWVGYGRLGMQRSGLTNFLATRGEGVSHAHNMYLETLLDNGFLGSLPIFLFFGTVVVSSARLFRSSDPMCSAVGGVALSMVLAQLIAGIGAQHFYPRESTLGMWAAMLLALRVSVERAKARAGAGCRPLPAALYPALPGRAPSHIPGCAPS